MSFRTAALTGAAVLVAASPAAAASQPSRATNSFLDSLGLNTHVLYGDSAYGDRAAFKRAMQEVRFRFVRDGITKNRPDVYSYFNELSAAGIKANLVLGRAQRKGVYDEKDSISAIDWQLDIIQNSMRFAVASVEGHNEYDIRGPDDWVPPLKAHQEALWTKVNSRTLLSHVAVLGPSLARATTNHKLLGNVEMWHDFGNEHTYPGGKTPSAELDRMISDGRINSPTKPLMSTETGYHSALLDQSGHPPTSERAIAIYLPRLFLEYFRRGFVRTYAYQLADAYDKPETDREFHFGLYDAYWRPKQSATAFKTMNGLFDGVRASYTTEPVDYTISGDQTGLRQMLLQKADGTQFLCLWREDAVVWDPVARKDLYPGTRRIWLKVNTPFAQMQVWRPTIQSTPRWTGAASTNIQLDMPADVVIVRLSQPENKAFKRPASASGTAGGETPDRAVDERLLNTRWTSPALDNSWWQADLGRSRSINKVSVRWDGTYARSWRVSTSPDNATWTTVTTVTATAPGVSTASFAARSARYVRVTALTRSDSAKGVSAKDIRVEGAAD